MIFIREINKAIKKKKNDHQMDWLFLHQRLTEAISDKQLTVDSGYLDLVEPYTEIMVDKGIKY